MKKWGSEEGLDSEHARRATARADRKEKQFNARLNDLRRKTRTDAWNAARRHGPPRKQKKTTGGPSATDWATRPHRHVFGDPVKKEGDVQTVTCRLCGLQQEYEEF